ERLEVRVGERPVGEVRTARVAPEARHREPGRRPDQILDRAADLEVDDVEARRLAVGVLEGAADRLGQNVDVVHDVRLPGRGAAEGARLEQGRGIEVAAHRVLELVVRVERGGGGGRRGGGAGGGGVRGVRSHEG